MAPAGNCYYAVVRGRKVGVYKSWAECETQVDDFDGAWFQKFETQAEADAFLRNNSTYRQPLADKKPKTITYHVVAKGRVPGIYWSWKDAEKQLQDFSRYVYRAFDSLQDAELFFDHYSK